MKLGRFLRTWVRRLLPVMLGFAAFGAAAQGDPPGRVGRLNHAEGAVTFAPAGDNEFVDAEVNRPLTRGDKLWTDKGARAEVQVGSSAVRMDGQTRMEVLALDDQATQLSVTQGSVYIRVRSLPEGENFEIDTPNLAYRAAYPGDYRIDVDSSRGTTRVTIHSGTGAVYGEGGQALPLGGGQQVTFRARALAQVASQESPPQDNFDRWAADRNRREDQSVAARYVPREVVGYQQLDAYGQWSQDATYGSVWTPQSVPANWAPYRNGRWEWMAPWGWTWIDDAPWAFAPSHYGRWALIGARWAWVPGRIGLRPIYAPALVAFIGGNGGWSVPVGGGKPGVAWFPLAPNEPWQPGYRATPLYISTVNRNMPPVPTGTGYAYKSRPEALTAIPAEDFHRGKPIRGSWLRVAANVITQAQVVMPPPMPERPGRGETPAVAKAAPPAATEIRQVGNASPTAQQKAEARQAAASGPERVQREQTLQAEQTKAAEQARVAEQTKVAQQAKAAEQAKASQHARAAEQAEAAQQARAAEQARAAQQARAAEQARAAQQAKLAEQAKAAQQAKLLAEQQAKASQQARAAEQARIAREARAAADARAAQQARAAEQARIAELEKAAARAKVARAAEPSKRELAARREQARREHVAAAQREQQAKREQATAARAQAAQREQLAKREEEARRAEQARRAAVARKEDQARRAVHAQQVEQARRAADRDAQALREQRMQREEAARREAEAREQAQREAWQRHQQALSEQWRRDQQAWEQQQRDRTRQQRPDLNRRVVPAEPEVWQRGIPILNPGRTS
jgi:hypothetical protein